ncbi:MAG: prepilin-type N-terminal cleavage/methylation domain-containing protein [Thermodesulfobacteriota bacterium]
MGIKRLKRGMAGNMPAANVRGFTLIELLMVLAILSVVMVATYSLYIMQQRITYVEVDVAEVQQNVRIAMDNIVSDLRLTGLLVPGGTDPLNAYSNNGGQNNSDTLTINTSSATGRFAVTSADLTTNVSMAVPIAFNVMSASEVDRFEIGDIARIINPGERGQPLNAYFTVTGKNSGVPSLTLTSSANGTNVKFKRGDIIARTGSSAPDTYPNTILYCVGPDAACGPAVTTCPAGQSCLIRIANNTPSIVATNMTDLQFRYILDGSTAETDGPADLSQVRAVRTVITGETVDTAALSGAGAKSREVNTVVKLRNR